jgi:hypothetical protein
VRGGIAMRRLGTIVALSTLLGLFGGVATGSPALAGRGPKWQFLPAPPFTLPAEFCGFKIRVTPVVNKAYAKVLKASDGSMISLSTGAFKLSYTNPHTGKTVTGNASGPSKTTVFSDGSALVTAKGHVGLFLPPDLAKRFGLPGVSVTAGALTIRFDSDGDVTSLSLHGHVLVDVCAALS